MQIRGRGYAAKLPFGTFTVTVHRTLIACTPDETVRLGSTVKDRYTLRMHAGDRTIEGWGETESEARMSFENTLEKWLSDGAK